MTEHAKAFGPLHYVSAHVKTEHKKCGAKAKQTGKPCQLPARFGTDHVGQRRCKFHGGCNPIKHGRYSKIVRKTVKEAYERHESDPNISDLRSEIALPRAYLEEFIDKTQNSIDWKFEDLVDMVLSFLTYTILYVMRVGEAITPLKDLSLWFSPLIAYSANSLWGHVVSVLKKKVAQT